MEYPLLFSVMQAKYYFNDVLIKELINSGDLIEWYNIAIL